MTTGILGTGSAVPENCVKNADLIRAGLDTTDEWIREHIGITQRYVTSVDEATSDLACIAASRALQAANVRASEVDLTICATSTPDYPLPSTAGLVQARLGCVGGAFDVNAVCSGFAYALITAYALHASGRYRHILVIGADTYSKIVDGRDRRTAVFFGDGAGAVVLGPSPSGSLLAAAEGSDGSQARHIMVSTGGSRRPASVERLSDGEGRFYMDGRAVWDFVLECFPQAVRTVSGRAGLNVADLKLVIPHQANQRLLRVCAQRLELRDDQLFTNVERFGNTAAASIPIALDEAVRAERLQPGDVAVLVGFGGGLAWAATCLRWG
jgi:3-oxoacyl-[acyl-carrier-protein] synthase-3